MDTVLTTGYIIDRGNFKGALFASAGRVQGLGSITTIPRSGWTNSIAVVGGGGYIAYSQDEYLRMYVSACTDSIAMVKYQGPFIGSEKEIQMETKTLFLDRNSNFCVEFFFF
jgi:hypothetical protein